jgi:hypothetical protein
LLQWGKVIDLARRVFGRCRPEPTLVRHSGIAQSQQRLLPLFNPITLDRRMNTLGQFGIVLFDCARDCRSK